MICEQMGIEPDPEEFPIDPALDFCYEAQQAYHMFCILPDSIDSMGGIWLGKNFAGLNDLFEIYHINNKYEVMDYLVYMIQIAKESYAKERELQSKIKKT
jgi:hypothetical protein